ncbi:MAG: CDF family Co(II)/Ni(II) efflux transporter DmeF [Burkholderiales bacterium]|nr:CDF family Co(II)/Ni(II) efflux transporter DmeF [Burkholderiales bacterium]
MWARDSSSVVLMAWACGRWGGGNCRSPGLRDDAPMHAPTPVHGHAHDLRPFHHSHAFGDGGEASRGRALLTVTIVTLVTMVAELAAGWWTGSLALLADGWHMGTHAVALGGAVLAIRWSRRAQHHEAFAQKFPFGGWKIEVLAAYTSALLLAAVAVGLAVDSVQTLIAPHPVNYADAMVVAVLGLVVNLASVWLLTRGGGGHDHHGHADPAAHEHEHAAHGHDHARPHAHHHDDHNYRAALVHVLADALTSLLAIAALAGGLWWGWRWLDPVVALVGAALIGQWSWGLIRASGRALVDATADAPLKQAVRAAIESDGDSKLADLHVWQIGGKAWAGALSVVADNPQSAQHYRERLHAVSALKHITIEVHRCTRCGT